jgi:cation:H+ antiporter
MSSALLIVAGLAGLLVGADLLVRSGAALASHLGVRPIVIGLTVVALILGITVMTAPAEVQIPDEVVAADLLVLAAVALITPPVLLLGQRISRLEGGAFVAAYLSYLVWLILL